MILRSLAVALHDLLHKPKLPPLPSRDEVYAKLRERAAEMGGNLDPVGSVVDRFKVLRLDSSKEARAEAWQELGLGLAVDYQGTAEQNDRLAEAIDHQLARGDFADRLS